jgi:Zn-dependent metalloprotease
MNEVSQREARGEPVQEHWASGVLSTAAYRMQQRIGGEAGWRAVEQVFYDVIDRNMLGDMKFATIAQSVRSAAAQRFGAASPTFAVINEELQRAGL